jgi:hypothetical protein
MHEKMWYGYEVMKGYDDYRVLAWLWGKFSQSRSRTFRPGSLV